MLRLALVLLVSFLAAAALPGSAPAQNPGVDLIPDGALAGFAIKNLDDLRAKGDKLAKDLQRPENSLDWLTDVFKLIKLEKGVNMKGSAAIRLPREQPWPGGSYFAATAVDACSSMCSPTNRASTSAGIAASVSEMSFERPSRFTV